MSRLVGKKTPVGCDQKIEEAEGCLGHRELLQCCIHAWIYIWPLQTLRCVMDLSKYCHRESWNNILKKWKKSNAILITSIDWLFNIRPFPLQDYGSVSPKPHQIAAVPTACVPWPWKGSGNLFWGYVNGSSRDLSIQQTLAEFVKKTRLIQVTFAGRVLAE